MSFLNILLLSFAAHFVGTVVSDVAGRGEKIKDSVRDHVLFMFVAIVTFAGASHLLALSLAVVRSGN